VLYANTTKEKTVEELKKERRIKYGIWLKTISIIIAFLALAYGIYNNGLKTDRADKKIDNLGEPVIVNKSGKPIDSRGLEVKMFGAKKDSAK
jgi:hypothetical protein